MKIIKKIMIVILALFVINCEDSVESNTVAPNDNGDNTGDTGDGENNSGGNDDQSPSEWLVPTNKVFDGGPGKDGIPALTNPIFTRIASIDYLSNNDLVIVVKHNGKVKIYPHNILDWHEIINDGIGDKKYSITYCPLTGSGISWNRNHEGQTSTFGVSGLLYNTNLIPYDRATNSNWSQMKLQCINGERIGEEIETYHIIETSWQTAKEAFPIAEVVSENTGYNRRYSIYPYGNYKTNHSSFLFPYENENNLLPNKERVLGLLNNGEAKAYSFNNFEGFTQIIKGNLGGENIIVIGNKESNFISAFKTNLNDVDMNFNAISDNFPIILTDDRGNIWDIFGNAVEGPDKGKTLEPVKGFIAYWFAWAAFYPNTLLE